MKTYKIIADARVRLDLQTAIIFFNERKKGLGMRFLQDYKKSLKTLKINPFFELRYHSVRCLPLENFKYMIHFSVFEETNTVMVYAVISTYLNPEENRV